MPQAASAGRAGGAAPPVPMLACQVSGGGHAIRDAGGHVLETGNGVPPSPPARGDTGECTPALDRPAPRWRAVRTVATPWRHLMVGECHTADQAWSR